MIKTLLIVILVIALGVITALTRPSPDDFKAYLKSSSGNSSSLVANVMSDFEANQYVNSCVFHNRIFWEDVYSNGQRVYVGVAEHYFKVH
jgi:hypothetical protein